MPLKAKVKKKKKPTESSIPEVKEETLSSKEEPKTEEPVKTEESPKTKEEPKQEKKKTEDYIFLKSDRIEYCDCSMKGFPNTAPVWVIAAMLFNLIKKEKLGGFDKEHWYMKSPIDGTPVILDDGKFYVVQYHNKLEPISVDDFNNSMLFTRLKPSRKKKAK